MSSDPQVDQAGQSSTWRGPVTRLSWNSSGRSLALVRECHCDCLQHISPCSSALQAFSEWYPVLTISVSCPFFQEQAKLLCWMYWLGGLWMWLVRWQWTTIQSASRSGENWDTYSSKMSFLRIWLSRKHFRLNNHRKLGLPSHFYFSWLTKMNFKLSTTFFSSLLFSCGLRRVSWTANSKQKSVKSWKNSTCRNAWTQVGLMSQFWQTCS